MNSLIVIPSAFTAAFIKGSDVGA